MWRQTQADGTTWGLTYTVDGQGKVTQAEVTDPRNYIRRLTFNGDGYPVTDTRAVNQAEQQVVVYERQPGTKLVTAVTDALGSILALTDDAGVVQTTYTYEPFGATTSSGQASGNPFQYTGRENDGTGLYYYRARYYHPTLQRFISEDPLEFAAGDTNLYVYVDNSPTDFVDPRGLYAVVDDILFTVGGGVVGLIGQGVGDLIARQHSSGLDYLAAFIGGAAGGEALLYMGPVGAGAIGGAVTGLTKQGLHCLAKRKCGFSATSLAVDTGVGALTGFIPGLRIPGITAGRNSYNAIFKQIVMKFQRQTISSVTLSTAAKMFVGRAVSTSLLPGVGAGAAAGVGAAKIRLHE